jgi:hypothetical protein
MIMKKIFLSVFFTLLVIPTTVALATSGTCSYHGGIIVLLEQIGMEVLYVMMDGVIAQNILQRCIL